MRYKLKRASLMLGFAFSSMLVLLGLASGIANAQNSNFAASDVYGQLTAEMPDFTTNGNGTTDSTFNYPSGTAIDAVHHLLFVGDDDNARVLVFQLDSNNAPASKHAIHVLGQTNTTSSNSGEGQDQLSNVYAGLAYDSVNNRLFVSDQGNHRVLVWDLSNGISDGMNAAYEIGQTGWDVAVASHTQAGMGYPVSLTFDPIHQHLFVADTFYDRVTVYDVNPSTIHNGEDALHVLGQADFTHKVQETTQNGMKMADSLAYNPTTQQLFVGDSESYRVLVFNLANGISDHMNASYVLGEPDFQTDNATDNMVAANTMSEFEEGLAVDSAHNILYVYDKQFNRILVFNLASGISSGMNANFVIGQADFTSSDFSCTTSATDLCDAESNLTIDPVAGRLFVADGGNNRVLVYDVPHTTNPSGSLGTVTIGSSASVALITTGVQGTVSYAVTSGSLPTGMTLDGTTGVISGQPTMPGTYNFEITTTDNEGAIGNFIEDPSYSITVSSVVAPDTGYGAPQPNMLAEVPIGAGLIVVVLAIRRYARKR